MSARSTRARFVLDTDGDIVACSKPEPAVIRSASLGALRQQLAASEEHLVMCCVARFAYAAVRLHGPAGPIWFVQQLANSLELLSPRQREVVELAGLGMTLKQAASELGISQHTAKQHLAQAYRHLGVRRREELVSLLAADA